MNYLVRTNFHYHHSVGHHHMIILRHHRHIYLILASPLLQHYNRVHRNMCNTCQWVRYFGRTIVYVHIIITCIMLRVLYLDHLIIHKHRNVQIVINLLCLTLEMHSYQTIRTYNHLHVQIIYLFICMATETCLFCRILHFGVCLCKTVRQFVQFQQYQRLILSYHFDIVFKLCP